MNSSFQTMQKLCNNNDLYNSLRLSCCPSVCPMRSTKDVKTTDVKGCTFHRKLGENFELHVMAWKYKAWPIDEYIIITPLHNDENISFKIFVIISVKLVYWVFLVGRIKALEWMLKVGNGKSLIWCTKEKTHFWSHIENQFCNFAHLPAITTLDHNGALSAGIGIICHFR